MTTDPLETLLAASKLRDGRIALDVNRDGQWRAGIVHFGGRHIHQPHAFGDPVEALRSALIEDDRRERDVVRRYEAAPKLGDVPPVVEVIEEGACMVCEGGGCDLCRPTTVATTNVEDMLG